MKRTVPLLSLLIFMIGGLVSADIPRTINYQGRLTDLNGNVLTNGIYALTITLYDSMVGGNVVWSDNYSAQTMNGYFNIVLGSNPARPLNIPFNKQYYLGIAVSPDAEMIPRQPLCSVPYSMTVAEGYILFGFRILTAGNGTYTPSPGTRAIIVECVGGGGGAGGCTQSPTTGGSTSGGGAGGYAKKWITSPAASYDYSIAASAPGGASGNNNGTGGDPTTFGAPAIIVCNGGGYSVGQNGAATPYVNNMVGAGGSAFGGDINVIGQSGTQGIQVALDQPCGGVGGSGIYGSGGGHIAKDSDGGDGAGFGSGGGGAGTISNSSNRAGGAGAPGVIYIWEYK